MNRDQALSILERALSLAQAETATVRLSGEREDATRYANNVITQNVSGNVTTLSVSAAFGQKVGSAETNQFSEDALRDVVQRAEEAARAADPDLEYLPPLGPQQYPDVSAFSEATSKASAADRAGIVASLVRDPAKAGYRAAGSVTTTTSFQAVATSAGLRAFHEWTDARLVNTVLAGDGSGWSGLSSHDIQSLPVEDLAGRACRKAEDARNPLEVTPGPTTVVLEPQAVADLLAWLAWDMDAKAADEGRNFWAGKEGQTIADSRVTIQSLPSHTLCKGFPFLDDGAAAEDVTWFENGTVRSLKTSRFWAEKTGRKRVGFPGNFVVQGQSGSSEDLVSRVKDGLLVTRFWYIRSVDPMKFLLTGMTRDGLYRIRDGQVVGAAKNMRFNESPVRMLNALEALGDAVPTRDNIAAPPLLVKDFRFTSVSAF